MRCSTGAVVRHKLEGIRFALNATLRLTTQITISDGGEGTLDRDSAGNRAPINITYRNSSRRSGCNQHTESKNRRQVDVTETDGVVTSGLE